MIDMDSGRFIAGGNMPLKWIDDKKAHEYTSENSKSSAYCVGLASLMNPMAHNVADIAYKRMVSMYENYQQRHRSMTFKDAVSAYLKDLPVELDPRHNSFEHTGSDKPIYLYPRHAMIRDFPDVHLEVLDFKMPVLVDWPPSLQSVPSFELHGNTTRALCTGPAADYLGPGEPPENQPGPRSRGTPHPDRRGAGGDAPQPGRQRANLDRPDVHRRVAGVGSGRCAGLTADRPQTQGRRHSGRDRTGPGADFRGRQAS